MGEDRVGQREEGGQASLRGESRDRSCVRAKREERKKRAQRRGNDEKSDGRLEKRLADWASRHRWW